MKSSTKITVLILSILPGLGQVLTGRYLRGTIIFFSFLVMLDLSFIILPCLWNEVMLARIVARPLAWGALIIWCLNLFDILRIIWWRERPGLRKRKKAIFEEAIRFYLQNNFAQARIKLDEILRLDQDDPDAFFYLGMIAKKEKKDDKAQKYWMRSLILDETEKWRWEINNMLRGR